MRGTVFSGDPTATTMGNTLRSIFYVQYYLHKIGLYDIPTPCAGDDACVVINKTQARRAYDAILDNTSRDKNTPSALG